MSDDNKTNAERRVAFHATLETFHDHIGSSSTRGVNSRNAIRYLQNILNSKSVDVADEDHFFNTVDVSSEDHTKWAYTNEKGTRTRASMSKVLDRILMMARADMPESVARVDVQKGHLATYWGEFCAYLKTDYKFEIVTGQLIMDAYRNGPQSCMSGAAADNTQLYVNNPESIALVKIMVNNEYIGRALLWTAQGGQRLLDRVYPSDGGMHTVRIREWAKREGIICRDHDSAGRGNGENEFWSGQHLVPINIVGPKRSPYMDSFGYLARRRTDNAFFTMTARKGAPEAEYETYGMQTIPEGTVPFWLVTDYRDGNIMFAPNEGTEISGHGWVRADDVGFTDGTFMKYEGEWVASEDLVDVIGQRKKSLKWNTNMYNTPDGNVVYFNQKKAVRDPLGYYYPKGYEVTPTHGLFAGIGLSTTTRLRALADGRVVTTGEANTYEALTNGENPRCAVQVNSHYNLPIEGGTVRVTYWTATRLDYRDYVTDNRMFMLPNSDVPAVLVGEHVVVQNKPSHRLALAEANIAGTNFIRLHQEYQNRRRQELLRADAAAVAARRAAEEQMTEEKKYAGKKSRADALEKVFTSVAQPVMIEIDWHNWTSNTVK